MESYKAFELETTFPIKCHFTDLNYFHSSWQQLLLKSQSKIEFQLYRHSQEWATFVINNKPQDGIWHFWAGAEGTIYNLRLWRAHLIEQWCAYTPKPLVVNLRTSPWMSRTNDIDAVLSATNIRQWFDVVEALSGKSQQSSICFVGYKEDITE